MKNRNARFASWFAWLTTTLFIFALPMSALAQCGKPDASRLHRSAKVLQGAQFAAPGQGNKNNSIVGLWHVTYVAPDGSTVYESFDQWHGDGNEFEVADVGVGVVCQGTWKQTPAGTVRLFHIGWKFDLNNVVNGTFTITQTNMVGGDGNSYQGTFELQNFDLDGNHIDGEDVSGTVKATRLTVN